MGPKPGKVLLFEALVDVGDLGGTSGVLGALGDGSLAGGGRKVNPGVDERVEPNPEVVVAVGPGGFEGGLNSNGVIVEGVKPDPAPVGAEGFERVAPNIEVAEGVKPDPDGVKPEGGKPDFVGCGGLGDVDLTPCMPEGGEGFGEVDLTPCIPSPLAGAGVNPVAGADARGVFGLLRPGLSKVYVAGGGGLNAAAAPVGVNPPPFVAAPAKEDTGLPPKM
jgi:hypothetical protein